MSSTVCIRLHGYHVGSSAPAVLEATRVKPDLKNNVFFILKSILIHYILSDY